MYFSPTFFLNANKIDWYLQEIKGRKDCKCIDHERDQRERDLSIWIWAMCKEIMTNKAVWYMKETFKVKKTYVHLTPGREKIEDSTMTSECAVWHWLEHLHWKSFICRVMHRQWTRRREKERYSFNLEGCCKTMRHLSRTGDKSRGGRRRRRYKEADRERTRERGECTMKCRSTYILAGDEFK